MSEPIENYVPQNVAGFYRRQARKVWLISLSVVFVWVFLILIAPVAEARGLTQISKPIYKFFSFLCHQMDDRSFHVENHPFGVCARCFGVYFGLLSGFLIYPLMRSIEEVEPLPRFWLFLAMIPMGVDWSLGIFGIWENTHWSRLLTGMILGFACAVFIVPALIEIFRLWSGRKPAKKLIV